MDGISIAWVGSGPQPSSTKAVADEPVFRLLGPLEVDAGGKLGGPRQRAVLAALLLRANDTASTAYLTRAAWEDPPVAPESNLRTYVAGLRRTLRDAGEDGRLCTRPTGYSLRVGPGELDLTRFEDLAARASQAADLPTTVALYREALALWRGQPLEGQPVGPALQAEIARLQDRRFAVIEQYCQARLELGQHRELAGELRWLVNEHPLREDLAAQLMLALYRSSRQAEALEVFRRTRERLVRDLGIEPGPRLQRMHQEILGTSVVPTAPGRDARPPREHRQLPMDINEFTGRYAELLLLRRMVDATRTAVVVCAIEGMGGVGKTRLAIHAAHQFACEGRFDEIQLWADLRGFDNEQKPADPGAVLEMFLHALGVPGEQVPHDLDERAALYRERLAGKRTLILLDNAASEEQVAPLLPGGPDCLVLVTTRCSLSGLDGASSLSLDVFSEGEALELLTRILGADRVAAEPVQAARIVRLCGYQPLAVTLAARRLRGRRTWRLADLADRLEVDDQRLDQLSVGPRAVRAVFELSYRALPDAERTMFRLLGLHPGDDFTADSAAAVVDVSPARAEMMLDTLLDCHLVEQIAPGRYRFHDLVRDYARERQREEETAAERLAAVRRLLGWYLYAADSAGRTLQPFRRRILLEAAEAPRHGLRFGQLADATAWLEAEHVNLVCAVRAAADHGCHRMAWQLASALLGWFYLRKPWHDWIACYRIALTCAQRANDLPGQAVALNGLGVAYSDLGQYDESISCHRQALAIERANGDCDGQAWNLNNIGVAYCDLGRLREAADCFHQALELHQVTGDRHGEGLALNNLGDTYRELGRLDLATEFLARAIAVQRANQDRASQRYTLSCRGDVHYARKDLVPAIADYREALAVSREVGDRWHLAIVLTRLAKPLRDSGEPAAAAACMREADAILDQLNRGADEAAGSVPTELPA